MGTVTVFKGIKASRLKKDEFRKEILNALRKEGTIHRQTLAKTVTGWTEEKPTFESEIHLDRHSGASVITGPSGTELAVQKWVWADEGTLPHLIVARNAPNLVFQVGYVPSTTPGKFTSRRKQRYGAWIRKKSVRHPGIEARNWSKTLTGRRKVPFRRAIIAAMQKAAKKAF